MKRLVLLVALLASCTSAEDEVLEAAYGIEAEGCSLVSTFGSGIAVLPGVVATSAHTVAGATTITVHASDGSTKSGELIGLDAAVDLALVAIDDGPALAAREAVEGEAGRLLAWSPDGFVTRPVEVTRRLVVTIEDIYIEDTVTRRAIEFEGDVQHGDSGGAVIGEDDAVIGIVYAASRERSVGFAIRAEELQHVLTNRSDVPIPSGRCVP